MICVCSERNSYRINSTFNDQRMLRHKYGAKREGGISCDNINCLQTLLAQAHAAAAAREEGHEEVTTPDPSSQSTPSTSSNHNRPFSTTSPTFSPSLAPLSSEAPSAASSEKDSLEPTIGSVSLPSEFFSQEPSLDPSLLPSSQPTISSAVPSLYPSPEITIDPSLSAFPSTNILVTSTTASQSTMIACNIDSKAVVEIQYKFAMEYDKSYEASNIIAALEAGMNVYIASELISCASTNNNRELEGIFWQRREFRKQEVGIVALDSKPEDKISDTDKCSTSTDINRCHVIEGSMKVHLSSTANHDLATLKVREEIRQYLASVPEIRGLFKTNYLSPKTVIPNEIETDNPERSDGFTVENGLSSRSITLFALAGVALMFSVVLAYNFRSSRMTHNSYIPPSPETNELKTSSLQIDPVATRSSEEEEEELSPFSRMMPAAYRLDDGQDEMSVILELNESSCSAKSASLIMSEGYSDDETTADDIDLSILNISRVSQAPVLGAKRRREGKSAGGDV